MNKNKLTKSLFLFLIIISIAIPVSSEESWKTVVNSFQTAFREVSKDVLPVVVELEVVSVQKRTTINPFSFFFGNQQTIPQEQEYRQQGLGSGVIFRRDGKKYYILTNNHVVADAETININLHDERTFQGEMVGTDTYSDLAVIAFETDETIPVAKLGNSDHLQVGDWVLAVGNPLGYESTVTAGIVSAIGRENDALNASSNNALNFGSSTDYIQTDAAINPGNSGGALVNLDGEVVGINTWIATSGSGSGNIGLGFAIPVNNTKRVVDSIINRGNMEYGWLGVSIGTVNEWLMDEMDLKNDKGAFVSNVNTNSPAEKGGIEPGDLILKVNNTSIETSKDLQDAIANTAPDTTVTIRIDRNGVEKNLRVKLMPRPSTENFNTQTWPGFTVYNVDEEIRRQMNLPKSAGSLAVTDVASGSEAALAGLRRGDVIKTLNGKKIDSLKEFYETVNSDKNVEMQIYRRGQILLVEIEK